MKHHQWLDQFTAKDIFAQIKYSREQDFHHPSSYEEVTE